MPCVKVAVIGDMHSWWTEFDTHYFNRSDYAALLFTGDLARIVGGIKDAKLISHLKKPTVVVPGNHDGVTLPQFLAELKDWDEISDKSAPGQIVRMAHFRKALGPVNLGGYSVHPLDLGELNLDLIVARPHSMGGKRLYFHQYLKTQFGITSLQSSTERLCRLVDTAGENIMFLAHNGPSGLGHTADSMWGCDFQPEAGDFGDRDLREAIDYAEAQGKKVWAVVAGHMHHRLKRQKGKQRIWRQVERETLYINAARVPRITKRQGKNWHHHVSVEFSEDRIRCEAVYVCAETDEVRLGAPPGK